MKKKLETFFACALIFPLSMRMKEPRIPGGQEIFSSKKTSYIEDTSNVPL